MIKLGLMDNFRKLYPGNVIKPTSSPDKTITCFLWLVSLWAMSNYLLDVWVEEISYEIVLLVALFFTFWPVCLSKEGEWWVMLEALGVIVFSASDLLLLFSEYLLLDEVKKRNNFWIPVKLRKRDREIKPLLPRQCDKDS